MKNKYFICFKHNLAIQNMADCVTGYISTVTIVRYQNEFEIQNIQKVLNLNSSIERRITTKTLFTA